MNPAEIEAYKDHLREELPDGLYIVENNSQLILATGKEGIIEYYVALKNEKELVVGKDISSTPEDQVYNNPGYDYDTIDQAVLEKLVMDFMDNAPRIKYCRPIPPKKETES